jgi:hypothetical protein
MMIHVDICPDCGDVAHGHMLDAPNFCPHDKERYVPDVYVSVREVSDLLRDYAKEYVNPQALWFAAMIENEFKSPEVDIR